MCDCILMVSSIPKLTLPGLVSYFPVICDGSICLAINSSRMLKGLRFGMSLVQNSQRILKLNIKGSKVWCRFLYSNNYLVKLNSVLVYVTI